MDNQIIEAEATPTEAVAIRTEQPVMAPGLFGATDPVDIIAKASAVATALKQVVVKQGLVSNISGKQYPRCEAWTLLGTMLGVFPVLVWTKQVEGGWEARVEARTKDGSIVGAAEAQCLRGEKNWANRDDFALRSMAQTRATAKCLRMPLGFVMTLSGFEATPAEEMVADHPPIERKPPTAAPQPKTERIPPSPEQFRTKFIANLEEGGLREKATQFCIDLAWLMPNEPLDQIPFRFVPQTKEQYVDFLTKLTKWSVTGKTEKPYEPNPEPEAPKKGVEVPRDSNTATSTDLDEVSDEPWYGVIVPVPHKGEKRDDYLKHPDTIGSLYGARHNDEEARKRLWGFLNNYEPKGWTKKDGTQMPPNAGDIKFREALDQFGGWFEKNHPGEKL